MTRNTNYVITEEFHNNADYISVNGFSKTRRKNNLKELLYFYLDLDVMNTALFNEITKKYNMFEHNVEEFNNAIDKEYINLIVNKCNELNIPEPTKINNSGNGYHIYWEIKEHSEAIKFEKFYGASFMQIHVYEYIEKELVNQFIELGADKRATDCTRLLRQEGSFNITSNTTCKEIYSTNIQVVFEEFANKLLKYTYEEVVAFKKITTKQKNFLIKNKIVSPQKAWRLDKFQAKKLIDEYISTDRSATLKQKEYLKILNIEHSENITKDEADFLIKQKKSKKSHNFDYIHRLLDKAIKFGDITEGNRAYFFYYLGIASRRLSLNVDEAISKAKEFNKDIKFEEKEVIYHTRQAYENKITLNIKISTILEHLSLDVAKYITKIKKPQKRAKKSQIELAYKKFKLDILKYINLSVRKIAEELNISKTTAAKFKTEFKNELRHYSKIKELVSNKLREILEEKFEVNSSNEIVISRIKNGFKIQKKDCPLIL